MIENPTEWKVLRFFSQNPTKEYYVKEISRKLNISSGSSSRVCKKLAESGILTKASKGNLLLYRMDNSNFRAKEMKRFIFLTELHKYIKYFKNEEYQLVALYGSYANGEYVEKSDIDILVITNVSDRKVRENLEILSKLGKEVSITVLPLSRWLELKNKGDPFYKEVVANHVVLHGEKLVI